MAERRMFAKTIIDSDAFLDLPTSTQNLYFHLGMRADDDGFVNGPRKIQKIIGSNDDDLKLLIAKKFIIPFESGVVVIKHWKMHNYIQSDRYKPTVYTNEKQQLITKDNKSYTLLESVDKSTMYPKCVQDVYTGKVRLGKVRLVKSKVRLIEKTKPIPYMEIVNLFNDVCISLPKILKLTDKRKEKIKLRYQEFDYDIEKFKEAFTLMEESDFMKGKNDTGWQGTFDWVMTNDLNIVKVLEGNYKNKKKKGSNPFKELLKEMDNDEKGNSSYDVDNKGCISGLLPPGE